jgi:hypothetical protein
VLMGREKGGGLVEGQRPSPKIMLRLVASVHAE